MILAFASFSLVVLTGETLYLRWENKQQNMGPHDSRLAGLTHAEASQLGHKHPEFHFTPKPTLNSGNIVEVHAQMRDGNRCYCHLSKGVQRRVLGFDYSILLVLFAPMKSPDEEISSVYNLP